MYVNKQHRPAKLSAGGGESVDVIVSLTQKYSTVDGRGHLSGELQTQTWPVALDTNEICNLVLEDGRQLEIIFIQKIHLSPFSSDSDKLVEARFMEATSMRT